MADIFQALAEVVCFYTGKILLPVLSLGHLRLDDNAYRPPKKWWGEKQFRRLSGGGIGVQAETVTLAGLLLWFVALAAGVVMWNWT